MSFKKLAISVSVIISALIYVTTSEFDEGYSGVALNFHAFVLGIFGYMSLSHNASKRELALKEFLFFLAPFVTATISGGFFVNESQQPKHMLHGFLLTYLPLILYLPTFCGAAKNSGTKHYLAR